MKLRVIGPNQTEISIGKSVILFSYDTPVAARIGGRAFKTSKRWSNTTAKHINQWLDGEEAEEADQSFFDGLQ